jgi:hypothetical protein
VQRGGAERDRDRKRTADSPKTAWVSHLDPFSPIGSFSGNSREHRENSRKRWGSRSAVPGCSRHARPQKDRKKVAAVLFCAPSASRVGDEPKSGGDVPAWFIDGLAWTAQTTRLPVGSGWSVGWDLPPRTVTGSVFAFLRCGLGPLGSRGCSHQLPQLDRVDSARRRVRCGGIHTLATCAAVPARRRSLMEVSCGWMSWPPRALSA